MGEFFKESACSTFGSLADMLVGKAPPSRIEQPTYRLDKETKGCDIPTFKHVEYRWAEAFRKLENVKS
jgi:hypothetical protein